MRRFFSIGLAMVLLLSVFVTNMLPVQAAMSSTAPAILNSASLTPKSTGDEKLDQLLTETLSRITTSGMSQFDQVKAVYDYLINNFYHDDSGSSGYTFDTTDSSLQEYLTALNEKSWMYYTIYGMLNFNRGDCYGYSFSFVALTRAFGFDSWVVMGKTTTTSGSYSNHAWAIIRIGDTEYVFDPDIDDRIAGSKGTGYYRFCKPYSQVTSKYRVYSNEESTNTYGNQTGDESPLILNVLKSMADRVLADNGQEFDASYYAATYPDVVAALGTDPAALLQHYNRYGAKEGRYPNANH